MKFDTHICGIPCVINVISYQPCVPAYISGPPERCYPAEGGEAQWEVLDRSGRYARWLENKLTNADIERIESEIVNLMESKDDYYDEEVQEDY